MTAHTSPRLRDRHALHKAIFRYTLISRIAAAITVLVVCLIWWAIINRVLRFGRTRDYAAFDTLGPELLAWIQKYNPFFWWGLVVVCSIFILYALYAFVVFLHRRSQHIPISARSLEQLLGELNPASREVLSWVWDDRKNPITVGVLQRTALALRQGRYDLIRLSQEHAQLINNSQPDIPMPRTQTKEVLHTI